MRNIQFRKRAKQLWAVLTHPSSLTSKNDRPWNNVLHASAKPVFTDGRTVVAASTVFKKLGIPEKTNTDTLLPDDRTPGGVTPTELTYLCHMAASLRPNKVLEVGTFLGRTTLNLANVLPNSQIQTFNWPQNLCSFPVGQKFKGTPQEDRITQVWGDTINFDFRTLPTYEFAFIDADHSYEMVLNDSQKVFSRLSTDGAIVWHDTGPNHLGSTRAVMEFCNANQLTFHIIEGTSLAVTSRRFGMN